MQEFCGAGCQSILEKMKLKLLGQRHDEVLIKTDLRYKHYRMNTALILKMAYYSGKKFGKTGGVRYYQILIPRQLVNQVLPSLHEEFRKHPGIAKTEIAHRENYHFPKMAQKIR